MSRIAPRRRSITPPAEQRPQRRHALDIVSAQEFLALRRFDRDLTLDAGGVPVRITSPDRVYWPDEGITKGELLQYYLRVAPAILPLLRGRPAILQRYPGGIPSPPFFQHHLEHAPEFLPTARLEHSNSTADYAVYSGLAALLYLVNLGNIEQHPWQARVEHIRFPDLLVIDLDPFGATWDTTVEVTLRTRSAFRRLALEAFVKTSGGKGLHVYVPLAPVYSHERTHAVAEAVCRFVAEQAPEQATPERSLQARKRGQVYMDWVQNGWGKSLASAYSVRARAGAHVSCPITWEELERGARLEDFDIHTVPERLASGVDPWRSMLELSQHLP